MHLSTAVLDAFFFSNLRSCYFLIVRENIEIWSIKTFNASKTHIRRASSGFPDINSMIKNLKEDNKTEKKMATFIQHLLEDLRKRAAKYIADILSNFTTSDKITSNFQLSKMKGRYTLTVK